MILHLDGGCWYLDLRGPMTPEDMSLDLAHHLVRRLSAGRVVVLCTDPRVFLSVIRKRWKRIARDVEIERARTLDPVKREALLHELYRLHATRIAAKPPSRTPASVCGHFMTIQAALDEPPLPSFVTLYLAAPISGIDLVAVTSTLNVGGLIVLYGPWKPDYEAVLRKKY